MTSRTQAREEARARRIAAERMAAGLPAEPESTSQDLDLDISYVRMLGEEVRARLFPAPKQSGQVPYPQPVKVRYQPTEDIDVWVLFVSEWTIQVVSDEPIEDVGEAVVRVFLGEVGLGAIDLTFGNEPEFLGNKSELLAALRGNEEPYTQAVVALLRAVAGVL